MPPSPTQPAKPTPPKQYFGKYRGIVLNNLDPMQLGRIMAQVTAVPSMLTNWAMPCVPYPAPNTPHTLIVPPVNTEVWIEFEQGNPDYPIWSGCFWSTGQPPLITASP